MKYLLGEPVGEYHKIETIKVLNLSVHHQVFHVTPDNEWPDKPKYIYWVFLLFQYYVTYLEVPLISMNMYLLELMPESYNLIYKVGVGVLL